MSFSTDLFFFALALASGLVYAAYALARRNDPPDARKPVRLWGEIFAVMLVIFIFRGFLFDWFRIPSGSMMPTLQVGDFVLVKKSAYGVRVPAAGFRLTDGDPPRRGEVIVFRKPGENTYYIKRVVGIPGDIVAYRDKKVLINDEPLQYRAPQQDDRNNPDADLRMTRFEENIPGRGWHDVLLDDDRSVFIRPPDPEWCALARDDGFPALICKVPPGGYFVLGDNRDHSQDSRFWGFVPRDRIVGPAVRVVFNFSDWQWRRAWLSLRLRNDNESDDNNPETVAPASN